mmetsp:Transcript_13448/g.29125  ORF Transcript_13448/g.29125 Transcript_13448/m.29125 type:complete len:237 (-) Transcript_13448:201-911(-)
MGNCLLINLSRVPASVSIKINKEHVLHYLGGIIKRLVIPQCILLPLFEIRLLLRLPFLLQSCWCCLDTVADAINNRLRTHRSAAADATARSTLTITSNFRRSLFIALIISSSIFPVGFLLEFSTAACGHLPVNHGPLAPLPTEPLSIAVMHLSASVGFVLRVDMTSVESLFAIVVCEVHFLDQLLMVLGGLRTGLRVRLVFYVLGRWSLSSGPARRLSTAPRRRRLPTVSTAPGAC